MAGLAESVTYQEYNVLLFAVCLGPSLSYGLVWSTMNVNKTARIQFSELFWIGLYATRKCLDGGV